MNNNIFLINKPLKWTSFDVVKKIRFLLKKRLSLSKLKVGHAGTLDPLATGLLILCTGKMTKKIPLIQQLNKTYLATIKLGYYTESFDREKDEIKVKNFKFLTFNDIYKLEKVFVGNLEQVPPKFSAVKINGKRAYKKARNNEEFVISPRPVFLNSFEIVSINFPFITIKVVCSKGTYIRSLANDIGKYLNCGAYLFDLKRTAIGKYKLDTALQMKFFETMLDKK
ncbi:MAG: tRNA pseudouridine(55) synthase TruB [Flavobacteriales bacterium]|nr:tRNA pseudouridine(55) synthase TruB [Flavobacteriales bacterium]|tara:strand:- start:69522 stop:70196 length:675 start_codon:yes stop_codon:yes gene_type:complete